MQRCSWHFVYSCKYYKQESWVARLTFFRKCYIAKFLKVLTFPKLDIASRRKFRVHVRLQEHPKILCRPQISIANYPFRQHRWVQKSGLILIELYTRSAKSINIFQIVPTTFSTQLKYSKVALQTWWLRELQRHRSLQTKSIFHAQFFSTF